MIPYWFPKSEVKDLANYEDFHKIGEGGFSEIYSAHRRIHGREEKLVVKRLKPAHRQNRPDYIEKFTNEAKILKQLSHPQIPRYIDGFSSEQEIFFVMEFIEGIGLHRLLRHAFLSKEKPSWGFSFNIVVRLLKVLEYLHQYQDEAGNPNPMIHSDVKPDNILITSDSHLTLIDFTMALFCGSQKTFLGGTRSYSPIEFFVGGAPSPQMDIYSAAVTLFDLLTLRSLIKNRATPVSIFMEILQKKNLEHVRAQNFPKSLEDALLRGLAYRAEDRFSGAGEFRSALSACAQQLGLDLNDREKFHREFEKFKKIS